MILRTRIEMQNRHKGLEGLKQYLCMVTNSYTASGGGLGNFNSDAASPGDLVNRNSSSDTSGLILTHEYSTSLHLDFDFLRRRVEEIQTKDNGHLRNRVT